jgi:hypothetical protein
VENRPGSGGNIGTEAVVRAPADDGYTLLQCGIFNATNAALYDKLNFNFLRDAGRERHPRQPRDGGEPIGSGQVGS